MEKTLPLRILIVDDDVDACANLGDILELDQHAVAFAHSAREALDSLELKTASVVLLDWKLPDASALEILPPLRRQSPDADVVIVTGHGDFSHAVAALREGAADFLLKPINADALRNSLQRLARHRWLAEEKSRSEAIFRNLVHAAPCLIAILRQDLSTMYFSPFAESLTGYSSAEIIDRHFIECLLPMSDRAAAEVLLRGLGPQQPISGRQWPVCCRDGTLRWLMWNAQWLEDVNGQPGILAVGHDVTEARRANERLVQSERLTAIGEAMTGLAHESRNALQRSQAFLELLAAEVSERPAALQLVSRIQEAQEHLHQLYEEVRQYAAPIRIERRRWLIDDLLLEAWAYLEIVRQDRDAQLTADEGHQSREIDVDRFLLQQVFRNILENSLAACADPVRILYCCSSVKNGSADWLRISLRDNGPGLTAEQRLRIFDPFYTTKTRGTGLGMTLCQRIVEAHGGTVSVGPGPGVEILIALPRAAD